MTHTSAMIDNMYDSYLSDAQRRASTGSDAAHRRTISLPWRKKQKYANLRRAAMRDVQALKLGRNHGMMYI